MTKSKHKSLVKHQFGRSAHDYATSDVHAEGESLQVLLESVAPNQNWSALDVATGAGHTAFAVAPLVGSVIATDITDEMLTATAELANDRGISNLKTAVADAEALPFEDNSFDLVTCRLAFHHFANQQNAINEFARVLKPNGIVGFTDNYTVEDPEAAKFYNHFERIRDPSHFWVHSKNRLKEFFSNAGLKIQRSKLLSKEFEFHQWANRQRVSEENKELLLSLLDSVPTALLPLFNPRKDATTAYFSLAEIVLSAKK